MSMILPLVKFQEFKDVSGNVVLIRALFQCFAESEVPQIIRPYDTPERAISETKDSLVSALDDIIFGELKEEIYNSRKRSGLAPQMKIAAGKWRNIFIHKVFNFFGWYKQDAADKTEPPVDNIKTKMPLGLRALTCFDCNKPFLILCLTQATGAEDGTVMEYGSEFRRNWLNQTRVDFCPHCGERWKDRSVDKDKFYTF